MKEGQENKWVKEFFTYNMGVEVFDDVYFQSFLYYSKYRLLGYFIYKHAGFEHIFSTLLGCSIYGYEGATFVFTLPTTFSPLNTPPPTDILNPYT